MFAHSPLESSVVRTMCDALSIHNTDSVSAGATTCLGMNLYKHVSFVIKVVLSTTDSITGVSLQQATDATGTSAKPVTGFQFAPTTVDATGQYITLEFDAANLDIANGFNHVRVKVSAAGSSALTVTVVAILSQPRFEKCAADSYTLALPQGLAAAS